MANDVVTLSIVPAPKWTNINRIHKETKILIHCLKTHRDNTAKQMAVTDATLRDAYLIIAMSTFTTCVSAPSDINLARSIATSLCQ